MSSWVLLLAVGVAHPAVPNPPPPTSMMVPGIISEEVCNKLGDSIIIGAGFFIMHWCLPQTKKTEEPDDKEKMQ